MITMKKEQKQIQENIKQLLNENGELKKQNDDMKKEIAFWISRAAESGSCIFTEAGLCGTSSNALMLYVCGKDKKPQDYPRDMDDWGRCERTIKTIPFKSWVDRLFDLPNEKGWKEYEAKIIIAATQRALDLNKQN